MLLNHFQANDKETGQGLVEYALVLPIFLMIVFFIIGFSSVLYDKASFNMALRESIFNIEFGDSDTAALKDYLNPYGMNDNRYSSPYENPYKKRDRSKYYYMNDKFIDGMTLEEYLKKEIKKKDSSINTERIEFLNFEPNQESKVGIYSGLQFYHYKKDHRDSHGLVYASNPNISTIIIAQVRVRYWIEPKGPFMEKMYPDGIPHEKVIFKSSRNFRWTPKVLNPSIPDDLRELE